MERFSARLIKKGFGATVASLPADLVITPESWSGNDRGGMKQATLSASGSAESLASLCGWLGDKLTIYNEHGDAVFWGILWDLEVSLGNITVSLSMDNISNKVAVLYPFIRADGSQESATTAWASDANSIAHYGTRELLYGMPESFSSSAVAVRDALLTRLSTPGPQVSSQTSNSFSARLTGMGLWYKASSIYFVNVDGLKEFTDENGTQTIGRYVTSNLISFGTLTPGGDADEMYISAGSFNPLTTDDTFTVSGASVGANNDTYTIDSQDATNQITIIGSFAAEAAGATIKLSMGDSIAMDNIAQSFTVATAWTCTHVALKARRLGVDPLPSDAFRVGLYANGAGVPGTLLSSVEVPGVDLHTELTWTEFALTTPVTFVAATTYWFQARRTGAANLSNGYEVAVDEGLGYAGSTMLLWTGSAWVARSPNAHMPFRLIGEISSTAQLKKAIDAVGDFNASIVQVDSGVPIRQYTNGEHSVMQELEDMLDSGTSTGERLIAYVAADDSVVVDVAKLSGGDNLILGQDGKLRYASGGLYPPGRLIAGQHIDVDSLLLLDGLGIRANRGAAIYIAESEYNASSGMLSVSGEGAPDPFKILKTTKG